MDFQTPTIFLKRLGGWQGYRPANTVIVTDIESIDGRQDNLFDLKKIYTFVQRCN